MPETLPDHRETECLPCKGNGINLIPGKEKKSSQGNASRMLNISHLII